jgi:hypothetical protein
MYISHKSNVLQQVHETEWQCRRLVKGLNKSEYWAWLDSVTSGDPPVVDLSGETGYTIVECTDENVQERLIQLSDYINQFRGPGEALVYNIKYYASKRDAEEILDNDGNSHDPKQYVQSHFVGDDTAKDARLLAEEWTNIRKERDRLLTASDWTQASDTALASAKVTAWATYRTSLRDLPDDQSSETTYADITWPTEPE